MLNKNVVYNFPEFSVGQAVDEKTGSLGVIIEIGPLEISLEEEAAKALILRISRALTEGMEDASE